MKRNMHGAADTFPPLLLRYLFLLQMIVDVSEIIKLLQHQSIADANIQSSTAEFVKFFTDIDTSCGEYEKIIRFIFSHPPEQLCHPIVVRFITLLIMYNPTNIKEYLYSYMISNYPKVINCFIETDMSMFEFYENLIKNSVDQTHENRFEDIAIFSAIALKQLRDETITEHPAIRFRKEDQYLKLISAVACRGRFLTVTTKKMLFSILIPMLGSQLQTGTKSILFKFFDHLLSIDCEETTQLIDMEFETLLNSNSIDSLIIVYVSLNKLVQSSSLESTLNEYVDEKMKACLRSLSTCSCCETFGNIIFRQYIEVFVFGKKSKKDSIRSLSSLIWNKLKVPAVTPRTSEKYCEHFSILTQKT